VTSDPTTLVPKVLEQFLGKTIDTRTLAAVVARYIAAGSGGAAP
jgi:hypothetical protein